MGKFEFKGELERKFGDDFEDNFESEFGGKFKFECEFKLNKTQIVKTKKKYN